MSDFVEGEQVSQPIQKEVTVSPRVIGQIIHKAYGLGFDGQPTQAATLDQLHAQGYSDKEIQFSLKAGLLSDAITDLAHTTDSEGFPPITTVWSSYAGEDEYVFDSPDDLRDQDGHLDYGRLKLYISGLIGNRTNEIFDGDFKRLHPNAQEILSRLCCTPGEEKEDIIEALDTGVNAITAMHHFLSKKVGPDMIGQSIERSLPTLYKIASQNMDGKGSVHLLENGLKQDLDPVQETELRMRLKDALSALPTEKIHGLRDYILEKELYGLTVYHNDSTEYTDALATIEEASKDPNTFISFIAGVDPQSEMDRFSSDVQDYFALSRKRAFYDIGLYFNRSNRTEKINPKLKEALSALELAWRVMTLNDEYYEIITPEDGIPVIKLKTVDNAGDGRTEKALLLRQVTTNSDTEEKMPADLIVPTSKTVRCSAIHARLPKQAIETLKPVMDMTNFHPDSMNGIAFTALLTLKAAQQAYPRAA